jgi:hypothetical protein
MPTQRAHAQDAGEADCRLGTDAECESARLWNLSWGCAVGCFLVTDAEGVKTLAI